MHIENCVLPFFLLITYLTKKEKFIGNDVNTGRAVSTIAMWISDAYMLARYHITRAGFINIGKPIDMELEKDTKAGTYFNVVSSEGENVFHKNLKNDIIDSCVSLVIFVLGIALRDKYGKEVSYSHSGYI
ncbi:hypothetical protein GPJ56_006882 [Histomonas meleagridis]|uniref:uncharacterized protein n=1 Tax=Histomonas meleagridis TaxID=135588 RepID=UPI003559DB37|nr:hypothetical protein GPJ56_006882 [Histomonas meleagridis]KAH0802371.1 hypothetical protein GO595_004984 [Histomonas meleagridis]